MKKRWKIFWIVCGSMFLIGIICCSVSWGMGTTLTDIAHQFPHGISWVSEDKTYGDPDDDDDQEEDNETDTDDDQDEQKQEETVQAQEKANMKDATGVIEGNGKATYQNIHEIKSTVREGRIHLKKAKTHMKSLAFVRLPKMEPYILHRIKRLKESRI